MHIMMKMWEMKHLGHEHKYTPMMEHATYIVAIDTSNGQQRDADNDMMPCSTQPSGRQFESRLGLLASQLEISQ